MSFGARALIRLDALDHNLQTIRQRAPDARVMAVIKANAYGHGMLAVARHLAAADAFGVARLPEARKLRAAGIDKPVILLAGVLTRDELHEAAEERCEIVVHCGEQLDLLRSTSIEPLTVWLKFDTGMNRLGFAADDAASTLDAARRITAIGELRLMTHLSTADETDSAVTREQLEVFRPLVEGFDGAVSIANSPATFAWDDVVNARHEFGFTGDHWIRPGIGLFGVSPFGDRTGAELGLKPVMQFEARLIACKPLKAGGRVGYKGRYVAERDTMLGIVSAGYGDGYSRHFRDGTPVLLNGRRVPLIGNVSMDMIAVDLGPDADDAPGDVATLWGDELPVEELAPWADAIPYELVCGVMNREAPEFGSGPS